MWVEESHPSSMIDAAGPELQDLATSAVRNTEADDCLLGRTRKEWEEFLYLCPSLGVIAQFVITVLFWNDCIAIPSLNASVLSFATVNLTLGLVKIIFRTEKTKRDFGSDPWLYLDIVLTIILVALAIWEATLTFGNFDRMGTSSGQCHIAIFLAAFISAVITIASIVIMVPYAVIVEWRKESIQAAEKERTDEERQKGDE